MLENNLSAGAAAELLGVSRQTFHSYLNGSSMPRKGVRAKAAELWGVQISSSQVLPDSSEKTPVAEQLEFSFWQKIDAIRENDLKVAFDREGRTLKVNVRIDIPA
jgi:predicted transcriptional regulator